MRLNPNHIADGEAAWGRSKLHHGQIVTYKGKPYVVTAVGYGSLLEGKIKIENEQETLIVQLKEVEE